MSNIILAESAATKKRRTSIIFKSIEFSMDLPNALQLSMKSITLMVSEINLNEITPTKPISPNLSSTLHE